MTITSSLGTRNTWKVVYDGNTMLTYNDGATPLWVSSSSSPSSSWGFYASVGGAWHTSSIKNVNVRLKYPYLCYDMSDCCQGQSTVILSNITTTSIPANTFRNCSLTSITIPETITKIDSNAFSGCNALTCINWNPYISRTIATTAIPTSITTCGYYDSIRLYITENGGWYGAGIGIAQLTFCYQTESSSSIVCSNDVGNNIIASSSLSASASHNAYPIATAFDNNIDTKWYSDDTGPGASFPRIVQVVLPIRVKLFSYDVHSQWAQQSPKAWSIDMRNSIDSTVVWTSIDKRVNQVFKDYEMKSFFICTGDRSITIPSTMPIVDNAYKGCQSLTSVVIAPIPTNISTTTGTIITIVVTIIVTSIIATIIIIIRCRTAIVVIHSSNWLPIRKIPS